LWWLLAAGVGFVDDLTSCMKIGLLEQGRLLLSHGHDIGQLLIFSQNENVRLVGMWLARGG